MLGRKELSVFALFLLAPCYCVGGIPLTPTSTLFNDTAEISFAPSLAFDNLTYTTSGSSFLGIKPSDPYTYTPPIGPPGQVTLEHWGGQVTLEHWGRPWVKKNTIETLFIKAFYTLSRSVSLCWDDFQTVTIRGLSLTGDVLQATAPVPWTQQIWTSNAGFVVEQLYTRGRLVLSLRKDPTRAPGLPLFFQIIQMCIILLSRAVQQFEDWVPQTELEFKIPQTLNPSTFQYVKGYLRLVTQAADNISQDSNSTRFLVGDYWGQWVAASVETREIRHSSGYRKLGRTRMFC